MTEQIINYAITAISSVGGTAVIGFAVKMFLRKHVTNKENEIKELKKLNDNLAKENKELKETIRDNNTVLLNAISEDRRRIDEVESNTNTAKSLCGKAEKLIDEATKIRNELKTMLNKED